MGDFHQGEFGVDEPKLAAAVFQVEPFLVVDLAGGTLDEAAQLLLNDGVLLLWAWHCCEHSATEFSVEGAGFRQFPELADGHQAGGR